jgi:Tfp pilus assembly protein PilW
MRALGRRLRRVRDDASGLSLIEVLVSSALSLVILAMVATMYIQVTKITTAANQTHNSNGVAANVANQLSAVLRVATTLAKNNVATPDPAIVSGTRSAVTVYSLSNTSATNPAPVRVSFTLASDGTVTEDRCAGVASGAYWTFGSCSTTSTRVIGEGILAPTGVANQLFTYLDVNGAQLVPGVGGTGSLTAAQRALVAKITITVRAQAPGSETDAVLFSNTVVLRNLGLDPVS